jgi:hypothetical protein
MKNFATTMLVLGIVATALPAARAADTICPPNPSPGSTVNGNLVVPSGASCLLSGVTVTGNVQVQTNATLSVFSDGTQGATIDGNVDVGAGASLFVSGFSEGVVSTIGGSIKADGCISAVLGPFTAVGGNVQAQQCLGLGVTDSEIEGNLYCTDNSTAGCLVLRNHVQGNVQMNHNTGADADHNTIGGNLRINDTSIVAVVVGNTIGGNLQCLRNTDIVGSDNTVEGRKRGQCTGF